MMKRDAFLGNPCLDSSPFSHSHGPMGEFQFAFVFGKNGRMEEWVNGRREEGQEGR